MGVLYNVTTGTAVSRGVVRARTLLDRLLGYLRVAHIPSDEGMWFERCSGIHTIGMRTSIDVILLDRMSRIVALRHRVAPNCPLVWDHRARTVIELAPGFLETTPVTIGDQLKLLESTSRRPALENGAPAMKHQSKTVLTDDRAATMVEYALILALIAMVVLVGVSSAGNVIRTGFTNISTAVSKA